MVPFNMASRFFIQLRSLSPDLAEVCVLDENLAASTGWLEIPGAAFQSDHELAVAVACAEHSDVEDMLGEAVSVAYAVYVNDKLFDLHGFWPRRSAIAAAAKLDTHLSCAPSRPPAPRF